MSNKTNNKKLDNRLVLNLLDDQPNLRVSMLDWNPKLQAAPLPPPPPTATVKPSAKAPPALRSRTSAAAQAAATAKQASQKKPVTEKIIRPSRSLKEMMSEYNRPRPSAIFKPNNALKANGRPAEFNSDSVEQIDLPEIPGRILRPS